MVAGDVCADLDVVDSTLVDERLVEHADLVDAHRHPDTEARKGERGKSQINASSISQRSQLSIKAIKQSV